MGARKARCPKCRKRRFYENLPSQRTAQATKKKRPTPICALCKARAAEEAEKASPITV